MNQSNDFGEGADRCRTRIAGEDAADRCDAPRHLGASHLLDEVQKVCSHFSVLKKGNLVHTGPVHEVTKGTETVEVFADTPNLNELLMTFSGTSSLNRENGSFQVALRDGFHSKDLNQFLFEKGIVASHLVTIKKSLEKQFLEILAGS